MERAKKVEGSSHKVYLMFSGTGFTPELTKAAHNMGERVRLLTLADIYGDRR